jgi:hypothetical protein
VITTITNSALDFHPDNQTSFGSNRSPSCYAKGFSVENNPMMRWPPTTG